ncbi:MAG: TIM barrel protein [Chitinophagaceae bacterium]|nr:TIM barrel protein [Chitinophagaceae bacterium]
MQLGISTYSFPWSVGIKDFPPTHPLTATELLQYAAEKNIRYIQFADNYPLHLLELQELNELKKKADHLNLKIQVGTRKLTVENIITYISIATIMETDFIRIVIDDENYHPSESHVIEVINQVLPYLNAAKLRLAIENHDRFPSKTLKHIIESTDDDLIAICLDSANSLGTGEGLGEVVSVLARYTVNLHIKDFTIQRLHHKMGFRITGCIAGEGMVNIPSLVNEVKNYGRCHSAILELWSEPKSTINETILNEKRSAERSIKYLKTILS